MTRTTCAVAAVRVASMVGLLAVFTVPAASHAKPPSSGPSGWGDTHDGGLVLGLHRGGVVPPELTVMPTRNDCQSHLDLRLEWDEADDVVTLELTGDDALDPHPDVDRTEGIDYFPNPFYPEPEDISDGRYQLWLVSARVR